MDRYAAAKPSNTHGGEREERGKVRLMGPKPIAFLSSFLKKKAEGLLDNVLQREVLRVNLLS